jgi:hypothetical protein
MNDYNYYRLTYAQACRKFCRNGGKAKLDAVCAAAASRFGVGVYADKEVEEENPRNNSLEVVFEYPWRKAKDFEAARASVINALLKRGMTIEYECNGDGNDCNGGTTIVIVYKVYGVY